jgi:hypothetical protein
MAGFINRIYEYSIHSDFQTVQFSPKHRRAVDSVPEWNDTPKKSLMLDSSVFHWEKYLSSGLSRNSSK